jgi:membrane protein involved in colicin uptake
MRKCLKEENAAEILGDKFDRNCSTLPVTPSAPVKTSAQKKADEKKAADKKAADKKAADKKAADKKATDNKNAIKADDKQVTPTMPDKGRLLVSSSSGDPHTKLETFNELITSC